MPFEKNTIRSLVLDRLSILLLNDIPYFPQVHDRVWQSSASLILSAKHMGEESFIENLEKTAPDCLFFSPERISSLFKEKKFLTFDSKNVFEDEESFQDFLYAVILYEISYKNKENLNDMFPLSEALFYLSFDFSTFYNWINNNEEGKKYFIKNINNCYKKNEKTLKIVFHNFDKKEFYSFFSNCEKYKKIFKEVLKFPINFFPYTNIQIKVFCDEKNLNTSILDFPDSSTLLLNKETIRWDYRANVSFLKEQFEIENMLTKDFNEEENLFFAKFFQSFENPVYKKDFNKLFLEAEGNIPPKFFILVLHLTISNMIKYKNKTKGFLNLERFYTAQAEAVDLQTELDMSIPLKDILLEDIKYICSSEETLSHLKTKCILFCKQVLDSYPTLKNEKIFFLDKKIEQFIRKLFKCHPSCNPKIEGKIKSIVVVTSKSKGKNFAIFKQNGTVTPFFYEKCFYNYEKPPSDKNNECNEKSKPICSYLRKAILPFTEKYKKNYIKQNTLEGTTFCLCEFTGKYIPVDKISVDHVIPFSRLVQEWAEEEGFKLENIRIIQQNPRVIVGIPYSEKEFGERWKEYHEEHAELQCIHVNINLDLKNMGRENHEFCEKLKKKYTLIFEKEYPYSS